MVELTFIKSFFVLLVVVFIVFLLVDRFYADQTRKLIKDSDDVIELKQTIIDDLKHQKELQYEVIRLLKIKVKKIEELNQRKNY